MRLFIAAEIEAPVSAAALEVIDQLRQRAVRLAPRSRVTWMSADRLHVTVRFIGHVDQTQASSIRGVLSATIPVDVFTLTVSGIGVFPPKGRPRVVWAGLTDGADRLVAVERNVTARLLRIGIPLEDRPFTPHLTLARVRDAAGLRAAVLLDGLTGTVLGTTRVDAITLFESRLSPKGPTYVPLQRSALGVPRSPMG
jgi:2'-5' RNA ligase